MTKEQQWASCAEMDGWLIHDGKNPAIKSGCGCGGFSKQGEGSHLMMEYVRACPNYDSYDVIIPLVRKQLSSDDICEKYREALLVAVFGTKDIDSIPELSEFEMTRRFVYATPSQLREALLRATGHWHD